MNWPCASIEPALSEAGMGRLLPDWPQRQRRFALADDLKTLNIIPSPPPRCELEPDVGTLLGWGYILEGSGLGAQIILKAVEESEDLAIRHTTHFLRHGHGCGLWKSFKATLAQVDNDREAIENACEAACSGFRMFETALI